MKDYVKVLNKENTSRENNVLLRIQDAELLTHLKKWHRYMSNKNRGKTAGTYLFHVEKFFDTTKKKVDNVTSNDIINYLGKLTKAGTISKARLSYSSLLEFYRYYEDLGKKEYPVRFRKVDNPKPKEKDTDPLEYDKHIKPIISAWGDSPRNQSAIHVLYEAMLRKMELLSLRVCDIDLKKNPAPVNVRLSKTESGKGRPTFIYNAIPILKEWLNIHPLRSLPNFNEAPLFCTSNGKPMLEGTLRNIINEGAKRAGVTRNIYPHLFRHSRAYELAQIYHFTPQELKKAGGWKNSNMLDTYYNPKAKDIKDKLLNGHGIKTVSQEQRENALKDRQIRLCPCGVENGHDVIFCKGCGVILNIKAYELEMKSKDNQIETLRDEMQMFREQMLSMFEKKLK